MTEQRIVKEIIIGNNNDDDLEVKIYNIKFNTRNEMLMKRDDLSYEVFDELKPHSYLDIVDLVRIRDGIANARIDFSVTSGEIEFRICFPKKRISLQDRKEKMNKNSYNKDWEDFCESVYEEIERIKNED